MNKPKFSTQQQIDYMKNIKGIKFNIVSEKDAFVFLKENNYYFKLKAFAKNYQKYEKTNDLNKIGRYINLEFAYLKELSTLDALLRKNIMNMVLDVEHFLKVKFIADISENEGEDGYSIVNEFINTTGSNVLDEIKSKSKNSYNYDLVNKYNDCFSVWSFIEVISFGSFIEFYNYYYFKYEDNPHVSRGLLYPIKCLRNAAAHNNCLIHKLTPPYTKEIIPNKKLKWIVSQIPEMPKKTYEAKMKNPVLHDIIALLEVYTQAVSPATAKYGMKSMNKFCDRCLKHKEYFIHNEVLKSNFAFLLKVVDFYSQMVYNKSVDQKTF